MKRILSQVLLLLLCVTLLTGCIKLPTLLPTTPKTWQEQYDLGVRYFNDGAYEESILAFTAAIELDPQRPEAYASRAEAYVLTGNEIAAREDIQAIMELSPDFDFTPYRELEPIVEELIPQDTQPDNTAPEKLLFLAEQYDADSFLTLSIMYSYDGAGRMTDWLCEEWFSDGDQWNYTHSETRHGYDANGLLVLEEDLSFHGITDSKQHTYDTNGRCVETLRYVNGQLRERTSYEYSPDGLLLATSQTSEYDTELFVCEFMYNDAGLPIQETRSLDGLTETITYEYDDQNRLIHEKGLEYSITYDYSVKPLVIQTVVTPSGDIFNTWLYMDQDLFHFYPNAVTCTFDEEGYVTTITPNDPEEDSFYVELCYIEAGSTGGEPTVEEMAETLKAIYNAGTDLSLGTYEVYPDEVLESADGWTFLIRYASTDENAQANTLVTTVFVNRSYEATDADGNFLMNLQDNFL